FLTRVCPSPRSPGSRGAMAGLELLFHSVAPGISCPQDALLCYLHWKLITHDYRCLGTGDQVRIQAGGGQLHSPGRAPLPPWKAGSRKRMANFTPLVGLLCTLPGRGPTKASPLSLSSLGGIIVAQPGANERKSEMLPAGWNADKELYTLRYRLKDDSRDLLLKGIMMDGSIILNVMHQSNLKVVRLVHGLSIGEMTLPLIKQDPMGPFAVGGEDLDPFGGRRGGMISDPLRSGYRNPIIDPSSGLPSRLPPGSVPPGARFDPFGPPGANRTG
ncbi:hypothetical protein JD844_019258, partial [Phrynosoma platyrhinos]